MPEASMNKNDQTVFGEHQIRAPGEILAVYAEPQPHPVSNAADGQFRSSVATAYARHHRASSFGVHDVGHVASSNRRSIRDEDDAVASLWAELARLVRLPVKLTNSMNCRCKLIGGVKIVQDFTFETEMVWSPDVVFPLRKRCWRPDEEFKKAQVNSGKRVSGSGRNRIRWF